MNYFVRRAWDVPQRRHTPIEVYRNRGLIRREFLQTLGLGAAGWGLGGLTIGCSRPSDSEIAEAGAVPPLPVASASVYPAERNPAFEYGRPETPARAAAEYTNFYEFSRSKNSWQYVSRFQPHPWAVEIDGLCSRPGTFDLDDLHQQMQFEERAYRFRCVEAWAMCVPWTGFPLRDLLKLVEPSSRARYVAFETFNRPEEAPILASDLAGGRPRFPWPYTEGLTIDEAANELAFLATGVYGEPLPKQHGAPIRLVLPWKYGFKSIKSIVRITLTDKQPATFWNTVDAREYDFQANVNPEVPHPRWSQRTERMLGTGERYETELYNGYGAYVAELYRA